MSSQSYRAAIMPLAVAAGFAACLIMNASAAQAQATKTSYKFQFGPGKAVPGYTQILPTTTYSDDLGYGLEPGSTPTAVTQSAKDPLESSYLTGDKSFFFSAAVPEGNYKVTVTLGDAKAASTTTVKAELRRLMLEHVQTDPGKFITRSFIVNVRTPQIAGGGTVKLKVPRESIQEAWAWDQRITLEFSDTHPAVDAVTIEKVDVPTIYILGDSTVCDQSGEPFCSWGQMFPRFFKPEIAIANHAESGETVASSTGAHRFDKVMSLVKPGDYVFMEYGHNDMKSKSPTASQDYQDNLKRWVDATKAKGAIPVLLTPVNRHTFEGTTVTNSLQDYPDKVRELAKQENVALIDLNAMTKTLYEALGPDGSIALFAQHGGGDYDHTHHGPYGAYEVAQCVVTGARQDNLGFVKYLDDSVPAFDPAHPDPLAKFDVPPSPGKPAPKPLGN
jgi:lysophospholipase L1-like esterase